jgi:hypothetical protein
LWGSRDQRLDCLATAADAIDAVIGKAGPSTEIRCSWMVTACRARPAMWGTWANGAQFSMPIMTGGASHGDKALFSRDQDNLRVLVNVSLAEERIWGATTAVANPACLLF